MQMSANFATKTMYYSLREMYLNVQWIKVFYGNMAHPIAMFVLWLACYGRLGIKERLLNFDLVEDARCCFCTQLETIQHLLFGCSVMKHIWKQVLEWLRIPHIPGECKE